MSLLTVLAVTVVVGVLLWAFNQYFPMDSRVRRALNVVVVLGLILWLLRVFGMFDEVLGVRVG